MKLLPKTPQAIPLPALLITVAIFLQAFCNQAFFVNVARVYSPDAGNLGYLVSLALVFTLVNTALLALLCWGRAAKPALVAILLLSAGAAYFMDQYNVIINDSMIDNTLKTDPGEVFDLMSLKLGTYLLMLGVLPSVLVWKLPISRPPLLHGLLRQLVTIAGALGLGVLLILASSTFYTSFLREHKPLRYYANPSYYLYSAVRYGQEMLDSSEHVFRPIGADAHIAGSGKHRELLVLVVGETARADHFSLNGYARETNPLLAKENVISFDNAWSCGTSTSWSVPCMFSMKTRRDFDRASAPREGNLLDVLQTAGVNVLWLDNNSDSKGVADRVTYRNYRSREVNTQCDDECRDVGMLEGVRQYIHGHPSGDIVIVLHQMGNHGPAYYKRYPPEFGKFQPVCRTNQFEQCSRQEIVNAYDNALLYTDYFLSQLIDLLKGYDSFEAAMIYVSDHGESLGENNIYLHGLPYMVAPEAQTRVPLIMWFGAGFDQSGVDLAALRHSVHQRYSHDNLFHTVLGLLEVQTSVYEPTLDMIRHPQAAD